MMNKFTKNSFFSRALSGEKPGASTEAKYRQQPVAYEVFKDHWKHATQIFSKSLITDDDIQIVKNHLNQMISLLLNELNNPNNYLSLKPLAFTHLNSTFDTADKTDYGPIWNFLFRNNIFEVVFLWSLSYPEYLFDLKFEQLKYYENLVYQMQTNEQTHLLLNVQIHRPLFSLLNHCSTHNSEPIEKLMISILNQLCVCICKNSELLEIFFQQAKMMSNSNGSGNSSFYMDDALNNSNSANSPYKFTTHFSTNKQYMQPTSTAKFFIFSLLIPYIHKEGALGQQARDALLMIMQLSMRNSNLARYIVDSTDFCPILATGLSGLYSELPQKLTSNENFDEIRYLKRDDILNIPSLNKFINSLEFCNNVIQVSNSLIANQLLQYVYYGFLVPVIAPALTQNCIDEIIAATAYLDLFLRTVNEPNLRKIFLKFILYAKFDEKGTLLDSLINRINSNTKLSLITLMLFYTMIDFNSEDVMYKLIFVYLMPCNHLMKSQILSIKQNSYEINGINANTFLSYATSYDKPVWLEPNSYSSSNVSSLSSILNQKESTPFSRWFNSSAEDLSNTVSYLDGSHFNFIDYLKDAQRGIACSTQISLKWSCFYDASTFTNESNSDSSQSQLTAKHTRPSHELDYDAEEYLLNLNIFTSSLSDPIKSARTTQNLFESNHLMEDNNNDYDSNECNRRESISSEKHQNSSDNASNSKKIKKKVKKLSKQTKVSSKNEDHELEKENCHINPSHENVNLTSTNEQSEKEKKRQRMRQRRRERASDFYFLSFDNELSDTGSSSVSEDENGHVKVVTVNKNEMKSDDYECDLTASATSRSSSVTLNHETVSQNSNLHEDSENMNTEYRQQLIEYLFNNKKNNKEFLNGNLNNFLDALDGFFSENKLALPEKNNDLNAMCEQIMNVYNKLITLQTNSVESVVNSECNKNEKTAEELCEDKVNEITHFPVYAGSNSICSNSTHSLNCENLDSGCVLESCASSVVNTNSISHNQNEVLSDARDSAEIGPFLTALFVRLDHMLSNPLQINFLLTGIIARLAYYPQLLLRSFLLNHNLVVQSNVKTLIQVLSTVKYKLDACSQSFNNFPLLYFKAKVCLVKRIIDTKSKPINTNKPTNEVTTNVQKESKPTTEIRFRDLVRKKSTFDRFINFFKSDEDKVEEIKYDPNPSVSKTNDSNRNTQNMLSIANALQSSCEVEVNVSDAKTKFSRNLAVDLKPASNAVDDYTLVEAEWENLETRNIAYSAVIFNEFIKEMAAVCQEHGLSTQD